MDALDPSLSIGYGVFEAGVDERVEDLSSRGFFLTTGAGVEPATVSV